MFAAAVEKDDYGFGRARLALLPNATALSLRAFLLDNVEPGSVLVTDSWSGYPPAARDLYSLKATSVAASGLQAHEVLPAVHRVFSLVKRWLGGTMQGSVSPEHLQAYFDESSFLFNRRKARSRGLLFHTLLSQAVGGEPVRYADLREAGKKRPAPTPPTGPRSLPRSLDIGYPDLPWRR